MRDFVNTIFWINIQPDTGTSTEIDTLSPSPPPVRAETSKLYRVPEYSDTILIEDELVSKRRLSLNVSRYSLIPLIET